MMTSPPRQSYSSVMIETVFDFKFYIDKISEFIISKSFQNEELLLQSLIKAEEEQINLRFENLQMEKRIKDLEQQLNSKIPQEDQLESSSQKKQNKQKVYDFSCNELPFKGSERMNISLEQQSRKQQNL